MGWFSRLFSKEKETQPIAPPKKDNEIRAKNEPVYHTIVRDFQGKFVKGNPYDLKRNPSTGRYMKRK